MRVFSIKHLLIFTAFAVFSITPFEKSHAQQDALFSQYMFNPFVVNPAYAGSRKSISSVLMLRQQWMGLDGAPEVGTFSVHSPILNKMALGVNGVYENVGPTKVSGMFATYAYHLPFKVAKLSLAVRVGGFFYNYNGSQVAYENPTDPFSSNATTKNFIPNFDFGAYYYSTRFYAGLSISHLTKDEIKNSFTEGSNAYLYRHVILTSGVVIKLSKILKLKPSVLIRYVSGAPISIDINANVLIKNLVWVGLSYREGNALVAFLEFNLSNQIRAGYSYDIPINKLSMFNTNTHEISLGFDIRTGSKKASKLINGIKLL